MHPKQTGHGKLRGANGGSGVVTVLITVAFIAALATSLLFLSYMNLQIKISDRQGRGSFYGAEAAMNEVRSGLQELATKAIADAYTAVLQNYSATVESEQSEAFSNAFIKALGEQKIGANALFTGGMTGGTTQYDLAVLKDLILTDPSRCEMAGTGAVDVNTTDGEITLKAITIRHTNARGYMTELSTDLTFKIPDFSYTLAQFSLGHLYNFIIVANEGLSVVTGKEAKVTGDVYAGKVNIAADAALVLKNGSTMISGSRAALSADNSNNGHIVIDGSVLANKGLIVEAGGILWAKQIRLQGNGATLNLGADSGTPGAADKGGDIYLADDLRILGNNSEVYINGRLYGFGQMPEGTLVPSGSLSSSIIVEGSGVSLNLSMVSDLMMAGVGFVDSGALGATTVGDVQMGNSLSVKSDQTAYLVPDSLITVNGEAGRPNPFVQSGSSSPTVTVDLDKAFLAGKSLRQHGVTEAKTLLFHLPSDSGSRIVYTFMKFSTPQAAAAYFAAYYEDNKEKVDQYLAYYFDELKLDRDNVRAQGSFYSQSGSSFNLEDGSQIASINAIAGLFRTRYNNIIASLTETSGPSGATVTPFEYFVDEGRINTELGSGIHAFTDSIGKTVGLIVCDANFTLDNTYPDVNVLLCTGNVTVTRDFTGLIMAKGTVTLHNNVEGTAYGYIAGKDITSAAFGSALENGGQTHKLISFMNGANDGTGAGTTTGEEVSWDLDQLVVYRNWKKN